MSKWRQFFRPRWMITTVLVIAAAAGMARLGIWQLDRLEQRRSFNARVMAQTSRPELNLNQEQPVDELYNMEYRPVRVRGEFDLNHAIVLRNQVHDNLLGYHLLVPLRIDNSDWVVLVDRGWIPFEQADDLSMYAVEGEVTVTGQIRRPQERAEIGGVPEPTLAAGQTRLAAYNIINLERMKDESGLPYLPVYIQQAGAMDNLTPPVAGYTALELSEGPHFGYALQWFSFAILLLGGYPFFVRYALWGKHKKNRQEIKSLSSVEQVDRGGEESGYADR